MRPLATAFRSEAVDVTTSSWILAATVVRPIAIQCNASTTITGRLSKDSASVSWVLPAGVHYLSFSWIDTSSSTKNGFKILYPES